MQKAGKDKSRESRLNWRINLLRTLTHHAAALSPLAAQQQQQQAQANEWLFLNEKKKMESTCLMSFCFPFFYLAARRCLLSLLPYMSPLPLTHNSSSNRPKKKKEKKKVFCDIFPSPFFALTSRLGRRILSVTQRVT